MVARGYGREGGFVDRARTRLWDGDPSPVVAKAYAALAEQADEARQQENREFGRLLADWPGSGPHEQSLLGVEAVLDRCIAPLARVQPVLVLVVDAMSMAVFRELEHDLVWRGWVELVAEDTRERPLVVAALPTVTEVSRTSLLCGTITSGHASKEKDSFSRHDGLRARRTAGAFSQGRPARDRRGRRLPPCVRGHCRPGPPRRGRRDQRGRRPPCEGRPGAPPLDRAAHPPPGRVARSLSLLRTRRGARERPRPCAGARDDAARRRRGRGALAARRRSSRRRRGAAAGSARRHRGRSPAGSVGANASASA